MIILNRPLYSGLDKENFFVFFLNILCINLAFWFDKTRSYVHTYIRTGKNLYPSGNFVARGDNKSELDIIVYCCSMIINTFE
jgi:hypothetical protein